MAPYACDMDMDTCSWRDSQSLGHNFKRLLLSRMAQASGRQLLWSLPFLSLLLGGVK